jgi:outer membrane receptor protein involved in Fe transport
MQDMTIALAARRATLFLYCCLCGSGMALGQISADVVHLDIPAQKLASALTQFGHDTATEIVFTPEAVNQKVSTAVKGDFTREQAIALLLGGTGLTYRITSLGAIVVASLALTDEPLQEIIVTASKRPDPLSKVPLSIVALTREAMDAQGVRNIQDIVNQTPGVDIGASPGNSSGIRISIRGIDSNAGAATTGVYIDDTPIQARNNEVNAAGTSFPEVFDLERIEVLRGPQGTLFGAGAEGGVIRFVTAQPSLDQYSGYSRAEVSSTDHGGPSGELGAAFGGPIIDGVLGFRASVWDRHDGGYIDRLAWETHDNFPNTDWTNSKVARMALVYAPTDGLTITPSVQFQEVYDHDSSTLWRLADDPSVAQYQSSAEPYTNGYQTRQPSDDSTTLASLKVESIRPVVTFTSVSSYYHRNNISVEDPTNTDTAAVLGPAYAFPVSPDGGIYTVTSLSHANQSVITEELRLQNSSADARVKWLGGVFFSQAKLHDSVAQPAVDFPALYQQATGDSFVADFGGPLLDGIYEYTGDERSTDTQEAIFGNVDYQFADQWTLTAGIRAALTKVEYSLVENGPEGPVADIPTRSAGSQKDHPVTPKIGVSWQPNDHNMLYASVAKGYRIGGVNTDIPAYCGAAAVDGASPTYKSDTTVSYELGSKSRLAGGKLQIDASIFHIKWNDIQQYLYFPCEYGFTSNSGTARSDGFDLNLNVQVMRNWTAGLSVGYTRAEFTSDTFDPAGQIVTFDGGTLGQTPWTFFGFSEYGFPISAGAKGYVRLQEKYKSKNHYLFGEQNTSALNYYYDPDFRPNDAINQLDFRAGVTFNGFDVSLFVANIANRNPELYVRDQVGSPLTTYSTIRPRTVGLTATYRY